jgi:flagellar biosynthesis protein FlhF
MQVKKFEAPTLQEALDNVKRELGPEAIILQTKKYKRGFGLMSKGSIEVTAAVSDRSTQKKVYAEARLPEPSRQAAQKLGADKQADLYERMTDTKTQRAAAKSAQAQSQARQAPAPSKPGPMATVAPTQRMAVQRAPAQNPTSITATRYIDIEDGPAVRGSQAPSPSSMPTGAGAVAGSFGDGMSMQEEVEHLKRMIGELKSAQDDGMNGSGAQVLMSQTKLNSPALQDAFEQLVINGMDKRFALQLIRAASFELGDQAQNPEAVADQLAAEIMSTTEISSALAGIAPGRTEGPAVLAVVGPTGVGKTTTVAKLASEAILRRNLRVGLINLDGYKVAAFDQLGTYAKILNVPFRSAATADDLRAAMADFKSLDLVLIDTTGRSQRDPGSLGEMQGMLATVPGARTHLVLSVTTRDNELYDMAHRFSVFRPEGLIVSKLDEGTIYGAIYNISQKAKLPLVYFTTGQRVPEDIEEATRERVAALVLDL